MCRDEMMVKCPSCGSFLRVQLVVRLSELTPEEAVWMDVKRAGQGVDDGADKNG